MASNMSVNVRAPIRLRCALSLEKAISIGLRREKEEPTPGIPHGLCRGGVLVGGEVVENDYGSRCKLRNQHLFDVRREGRTIHCPLDYPRRDHGIGGKARYKRLRAPRAERRVHDQTVPARGPSSEPGKVRLYRGFVNEDNALGLRRHGRNAMLEPGLALPPYLGSIALGGNQRLFLCV